MDAPAFAGALFARLCRGDNRILSSNGAVEDADLFRRVEAEEDECRTYFAPLGYRLERGDNCYYFVAEDEAQATQEGKLERMIRLVRLLDFLTTHIENFGEGVTFSATTLAARCQGDSRAERFLQENSRGNNHAEQVESLLQSLQRQGYLFMTDGRRQEFRVLSAINYLFEFADRIALREGDSTPPAAPLDHAEA